MSAPLVSVITPMRDGGAFIAAAIASVQAQQMAAWEHLVVDDGSVDDGPERVRVAAAEDARIRLLQPGGPRGPAAARNSAIEAARGRYIAFLDCDDLWAPAKLASQIGAMQAEGAAFSWTGYDIADTQGRVIRTQRVPVGGGVGALLDRKLVIGCLTAVYDREMLGRMYMSRDDPPEDFCLWLDVLARCAAEGRPVLGIDRSLAIYRRHAAGRSARKGRAAAAYWRACRHHADLSFPRAARHFLNYAGRSLWVRLRRNRD